MTAPGVVGLPWIGGLTAGEALDDLLTHRRNQRSLGTDLLRAHPYRVTARRPSPLPTPHDSLFKFVFSQPEHAASELRAVLPQELSAKIDWSTLVLVPATFVDERLTKRHADLLFTVRCAGRETFLYVLLEHQSSVDTLMAFRVLVYVVRIWERFLLAHPDARRLPAVLPVVIHHGDGAWTAATELSALVDLDDATLAVLAEHVPRFRFLLDDLTAANEAPRVESFTALAAVTRFLLARARGNVRFGEELEQRVELFRRILATASGKAALAALLRYVAFVGDVAQAHLERFVQQLGPAAMEAYMTTAQQLIEQGKAEGKAELMTTAQRLIEQGKAELMTTAQQLIEQGKAEGKAELMTTAQQLIEQGKAEGKAEVVLRLLEVRFGPLSSNVSARVMGAADAALSTWAERVLTAKSLDDVLDFATGRDR